MQTYQAPLTPLTMIMENNFLVDSVQALREFFWDPERFTISPKTNGMKESYRSWIWEYVVAPSVPSVVAIPTPDPTGAGISHVFMSVSDVWYLWLPFNERFADEFVDELEQVLRDRVWQRHEQILEICSIPFYTPEYMLCDVRKQRYEQLLKTCGISTYTPQDMLRDVQRQLTRYNGHKDNRHKDLPIVIGKTTVHARYDTGAEANFISKSLAKHLSLDVKPVKSGEGVFSLPNGKTVKSIGRVDVGCSFARDKRVTQQCSFWVWDTVAGSGLVMGRVFLEATETLTKYLHRLAPKRGGLSRYMLHNINSQNDDWVQRLQCGVDGENVLVNPDTGSDLDIMSLSYARRKGYNINRSIQREVLLGDGTVMHTLGQVREIPVSLGANRSLCTFDILPGIMSDIIFGELTLEALEAYTKHHDYFLHVDAGMRYGYMHAIVDRGLLYQLRDRLSLSRKYKKSNTTNTPLTTSTHDAELVEQCRRDAADRFIASLSDDNQKALAVKAERLKREDFDKKISPS